jgi:hypothetical protein
MAGVKITWNIIFYGHGHFWKLKFDYDDIDFSLEYQLLYILKKLINNSRGKYKRNECLINVCKSDTDLSWFT